MSHIDANEALVIAPDFITPLTSLRGIGYVLQPSGFPLRKWNANDTILLQNISYNNLAKQVALINFIDIQGAANNMSHVVIERALKKKNIPNLVIRWIIN